MYISRETAQEIVEEIGREIGEHINLMDAEGNVIASTDHLRIGHVHDGAVRIIKEGLPELYITEEMETENTLQGINLPLTVCGETVGVVGITGERTRVSGYGKIVRRMTEIMMENAAQQDTRRYNLRARYQFLEEWIARSGGSFGRDFRMKAVQYGIEIDKGYRVLVLLFEQYGQLSETPKGQKLLEEMETTIRHEMERKKVLYLRRPTMQICFLPLCEEARLIRTVRKLQEQLEDAYCQSLIAGYDSKKGDKTQVRQSLWQARRAAEYAQIAGTVLQGYDELGIELLLMELPDEIVQEYLKKLFGKLPTEKLAEYMEIITAYFECDGSITRASDMLCIHKNTLQYKLKKLAELTGTDIRIPSGASVFYVALICYQKLMDGPGRPLRRNDNQTSGIPE